MNLQVSAPYAMYPVGTDEGYSPVSLQQNSGAVGYFRVNTMNGVWSGGTTGFDMAETQSVVDRTWDIQSVNGGAVDLNMMTMWSSEMEVNDFDRTDAYIMHYTAGSWDSESLSGDAAVTVGTMYQIERENITSLSPFAVGSGEVSGINEVEAISAQIYPNPVQTVLNSVATFDEATTAQVVDITGNVLYTQNVDGTGTLNHTIDFSAFPNGVYFVKYSNTKGTSSYRVVKSL